MKIKIKTAIILIILVIFLPSVSKIKRNFDSSTIESLVNLKNSFEKRIKNANHWNLTGSPIYIDDSNPNYNWSKTAAENDWCIGNGLKDNPYIIENVTIGSNTVGNCIEIKNSIAYFIIRNCIVYNAGPIEALRYIGAGIRLENVVNGALLNNNCSSNKGPGIMLTVCENNTISGNILCYNEYIIVNIFWEANLGYGMYLDRSNNNTLSENTVNNNDLYGIYLSNSNENTVSGNIISYNGQRGIFLERSYNNTLSKNYMQESGLYIDGLFEELVSNNIDPTNLVNGKPLYYYINEKGLEPHKFLNGGQVILVNCSDSTVSGLDVSHGTWGITLHYSRNISILNNNASYNKDYGIYISNSIENTILGNHLICNGRFGLYLVKSYNNTIMRNKISYNKISGIWLYNGNNNTLSGNNISYNIGDGMHFFRSDNNTLFENTLNNNGGSGILLVESNYITAVKNNASKNEIAGIILMDSKFNSILNNKANFNDNYGIYLSQSHNNDFIRNNLSNNIEVGILLEYSNENEIRENKINYNYIGIKLFHSNYNYIEFNDLSGNVKDIEEIDCEGNIFKLEDVPFKNITILIVIPLIILIVIIVLYHSKRK